MTRGEACNSVTLSLPPEDEAICLFAGLLPNPDMPLSQSESFFQLEKQHDALKKKTMDKTLENTLKVSINTKLPTCDDKGVFTDDDDTYRKRK